MRKREREKKWGFAYLCGSFSRPNDNDYDINAMQKISIYMSALSDHPFIPFTRNRWSRKGGEIRYTLSFISSQAEGVVTVIGGLTEQKQCGPYNKCFGRGAENTKAGLCEALSTSRL